MSAADDFFLDRHVATFDPNDPLTRLSDAAETATDEYATAIKDLTEAEILYRQGWDAIYKACRPLAKSNADAERTADMDTRDVWARYKRAEADERAADKRLRTTLARLSALQTISNAVRVQT